MKLLFDVTAAEFQIIRDVLATHLGDGCHAWVFGSRAKNTARFNSDLDLAIECAEPLSKQALIALNEAFDEAKLAFSVDVVDLKTVEPYFKEIIDSHKVVFPYPHPNPLPEGEGVDSAEHAVNSLSLGERARVREQNVPQLRFPEFSGEWEECVLGQLLNGISSGRSKKDDSGKYELYGSTGVIGKTFDCFYSGCFILVARVGANAGYLTKIDGEIGVTDNTLVLVPKDSQNRDFIFLLLNKFNLNKLVFGSGQPLITGGQLKGLSLLLPSLPEQTKIAAFLSAVDTKIDQLTQKKTLLETYKKGAMQQIFSQQIRFKADDGGEYPEWEEKKLGEVGTFFSGGTPTSTKKEYYSGSIPFIGSGKIGSTEVEQFITEEALTNSSAKMVRKGDLLYALYGATSGEVAISKIDGAINQAVLCIRSKENIVFIFYWLFFEKENILSTYLQGGQGNLSAQIIKSLVLPLPSYAEQTKIANFLSAIDRKIYLVSQQLEQAKAFKKGLLQQMFV